ncbi:hypothetical protein QL285_013459 [Trifolium repens]|nr:hypothetical protein QL285_013459 [Trifolium repens]
MASITSQSTVTKTFAQALSNSCNIPASQLPKPCLKGKQVSIKITEDEYLAGVLDCQNVLHGRFTLPKGSSSVPMLDLKAKILKFWKTSAPWSMVSLGKGYFEFIFSSLDDLSAIRSIGSWNLSPGFLRTFAWTADFNPHIVQHTIAQTWIRIHGLAREYWRPTILFEIAGALGIPLSLDEATRKRTFGHFARVLIEVDLNSDLHERILVERNAFDFYVDIEYEKLPLFCNSCQIIGHSVENCKYLTPKPITSSTTVNKPKARPISNVEKPLEGSIPNIATDCSKIVVDIDPLVDDIIRSKEALTSMFVGAVLNHEKEIPFICVEPAPAGVQDTSSSSDMASPIVRDVSNLENEAFCEELHEEDEVVADSIPLKNQARPIVVPKSNLSNFSANVIHDMQVLGLLNAPSTTQQTVDFLSNSWANMTQNEEIVDLAGNTDQQFQLVVPRKGKNKFKQKQADASKGFKVGAFNH